MQSPPKVSLPPTLQSEAAMSLYLMEISLANVHEVVQSIAQQLEDAAYNDDIPLSNLLSLSHVVYKLD